MSSLLYWNAGQMLPSLFTGTLPVRCCQQSCQSRLSRCVRKQPSPWAPEVTFSPPCASQGIGTVIASTQQIKLIQIKHKPFRQPFLLPQQAKGNAVNKWKGSMLPLFPDSQHQMRAQGSDQGEYSWWETICGLLEISYQEGPICLHTHLSLWPGFSKWCYSLLPLPFLLLFGTKKYQGIS